MRLLECGDSSFPHSISDFYMSRIMPVYTCMSVNIFDPKKEMNRYFVLAGFEAPDTIQR